MINVASVCPGKAALTAASLRRQSTFAEINALVLVVISKCVATKKAATMVNARHATTMRQGRRALLATVSKMLCSITVRSRPISA
jgi:hypothetical protein